MVVERVSKEPVSACFGQCSGMPRGSRPVDPRVREHTTHENYRRYAGERRGNSSRRVPRGLISRPGKLAAFGSFC